MTDFTIGNVFTLPSNGLVYDKKVNPEVTLRSMTTADEMKRLNHSDREYQMMSMVLDDCIVSDLGISSYDLCVPDYQFLLHRLRVVTYGPNYQSASVCPYCGNDNIHLTSLIDDLGLEPFDIETYKKCSDIILPSSEHRIKLKVQTPRIIDDTDIRIKEARKANSDSFTDPTFLIKLCSFIDTIDGKYYEDFEISEFVRKLPMMDTNYIRKAGDKLNNFFGINPIMKLQCEACKLHYRTSFRVSSEFFGPSIDL